MIKPGGSSATDFSARSVECLRQNMPHIPVMTDSVWKSKADSTQKDISGGVFNGDAAVKHFCKSEKNLKKECSTNSSDKFYVRADSFEGQFYVTPSTIKYQYIYKPKQ